MEKKPHLLIYSDSHVLGGADRYLLSVIPALLEDWRITYVYRKDVDFKFLTQELEKIGVNCLAVAYPDFNWHSFAGLWKLFQTQKPDLIVFNQGSFYTSKIARLTAEILNLPQIIIQHGSTFEGKKFYSLANRLFAYFTFPKALAMIVPSKASELFFKQYFPKLKQITVINHGIDLVKFDQKKYNRVNLRQKFKIPSQAIVLAYIGRLEPDKNAQHLLEIYKNIDEPNLHFIILGKGSLENELKKQAKTLAPDRIHFMGETDGTAEYLAVSDILVQTSRSESFSLAVVEAMVMGVVPVAFKVDSLPAIIGEESLTVTCPDFTQIAKIIKNLVQNKTKRIELAIKLQTRAKRLFNQERMQTQIRFLLQTIKKKGHKNGNQ